MSYWEKFRQKFQQALANQFIRNLSWLGASAMIIRVSRLITTFGLARFLSEYDYGLAAIVLTTQEFTQVFTRSGISSKLIQAKDEDLDELCNDAYWLNWLIFISLFLAQCLCSFAIAWFYQDNHLILPICVAAINYLISPLSRINSYLVLRNNRLEVRALAHVLTISSGNILSLLFAYLGMGIWAIVLPQILVSPLLLYIYHIYQPWQPPRQITTKKWREIFDFGKNILGAEILYTLRNNLDYLLIGKFVGIEELGLYYFAFNAGLGISLSVINAIKSAILPHLCSLRSNRQELKQQYFRSFKIIAAIIVPMVLLQSSLAPIYVPIIFSDKWVEAIPILMLICLSAIPRPFADAASQLLVTVGKPELDLRWNTLFTLLFTIMLLIVISWKSILLVAIAVLLIHLIALPVFTLWANRYAFK